MLDEAIPVEDIADDSIHMLLYGKNRIGKTTLACQFPKPLLLVSLEPNRTGGSRSVRKVPGVTYLRLQESYKVRRLGVELRNECKFASVVMDSATSLEDILLKEICGWDKVAEMLSWGSVTQDQYRERSERMRELVRPFLELPSHVVVIANEKDHNPPEARKSALVRGPQSESFYAAAMGGATAKWVQDCCDYICQLYMDKEVVTRTRTLAGKTVETEEETGRFVRRLRTMYHPNFSAGFRSENPDSVPEYIEEPTFDKILSVVKGE